MKTITKIKVLLLTGLILNSPVIIQAQTWVDVISNTDRDLNSITFASPMLGWVVGHEGEIRFTINGGANWLPQVSGTDRDLNSVFFISPLIGWAVGQEGTILRTTTGGLVWLGGQNSPNALRDDDSIQDLNSVSFINPLVGWIAGNGGKIFYTIDGGMNFNMQMSGSVNDLRSIFFITNIGFAVGSSGTILKTTNGGLNWMSDSSGTMNELNSVFFRTPMLGWTVGQNGTILRTTNGGGMWMRDSSGIGEDLNSVFFISDFIGYTIGHGGHIFKSTNGGMTWQMQQSPTDRDLESLVFTAVSGFACGVEGTIIKTEGPSGISEINSKTPDKFTLSQNYPNPFNPTTDIKFSVSKASLVKLLIFDIIGREVETLVNDNLNPGTYKVSWNAGRFASGMYFFRLQAGSFVETKKMILLK